MDINNNQQINTFTKGMNTDTSDAFIGADQYRYAENLRISTDTNSSGGALVPIDGTVGISKDNSICDWDNIIAVTSARDILVVVGIKTIQRKIYMQVYEYNTSDKELLGLPPATWRVMLVEGEDSNGMLIGNQSSVPTSISTVVRWESDKNVKLYIADGVHTLMTVRLDKLTDVKESEGATDSFGMILQPPIAQVTSDSVGNVRAVKVQYVYVLYIESGQSTALSPLSKQVILYETDTTGYGLDDGEGASTGKAIRVLIPESTIQLIQDNNSAVNAMTVYRIAYLLTGHDPKINKIYEGQITNEFVDTGIDLESPEITMELLMAINASLTRPHEIESKGNYLFLANISYVKDGVDEKFKSVDTTAPSSGGDEAFKTYTWNPEHWKNPENPEQFGGQGLFFKWEYTFKDVSMTLNNEITDGDDLTSLRRGEVYRYGVILYDEHGNESSPKFIADIMIPPESEPGFEVVKNINGTGATLRRIGIKFSVVGNLLRAGVYGWQIVRCNRSYNDKINLFQGICSLPLRLYKDGQERFNWAETNARWTSQHFKSLKAQNKLYNGGFMSMLYYRDAWNSLSNAAYTDTKTLMFACPEFCYMQTDTENQIKNVKQYNLIFEPTICYSIPTYTDHAAGKIYIKPKNNYPNKATVAGFRYLNTATCFGSDDSGIKPGQDSLWVDVNGPYGSVDDASTNPYILGLYDVESVHYTANRDHYHHVGLYHIVPEAFYNIKETTTLPNNSTEIQSFTPVTVSDTQYKSFSDGENLTFSSGDGVFITGDGSSFINWIAAGLDTSFYPEAEITSEVKKALTGDTTLDIIQGNPKATGLVRYAATGGKCMLFQAKQDLNFGYFNSPNDDMFPIQIGNIKNAHPVPYGGNTDQSKLNSVYYADGNFSKETTEGSYMDVFDGDTYLCMFTYNAAHCFVDEKYWKLDRIGIVYTVPIESSVNLRARAGYLYTDIQSPTTMSSFIQDHEIDTQSIYTLTYTQTKKAYIYNAAYDSLSTVIRYLPVYYNSVLSNVYDTRIHFTGEKINNAGGSDVWLTTSGNSYIDVDSRYGAVTNMRLFKDKLIFWQERATGLLTVNEKTVVQNTDGEDIILADNSGVVPRYDYISTKYGMKKGQHTDTQSDNAIYWWDSDNKELLLYSNGLVPLSKAHLVENYINDKDESVKPCLSYYCDFDEIISNVRRSPGNDGESLVFNEKLNAFTGVYTFDPIYSVSIGNNLYLAKAKGYNQNNKAEMYVLSPTKSRTDTTLFDNPAYPLVKYIVNNQSSFVKVFDIQTFGGDFYGGGGHGERSTNQENVPELSKYPRVTFTGNDSSALSPLTLSYTTPLKLSASISGDKMSNREYDFRLDIPRNNNMQKWGDRLRGKTMQCEIKSSSNSLEFSLQYVITKYRMSWS